MATGAFSVLDDVRNVFADTSYFFALLCARDPQSVRAKQIALELGRRDIRVATSWEIVVETATLLRYRLAFEPVKSFLTVVLPGIAVLAPTEEERLLACETFLRRSREMKLSLCDALSYVIVSKRLDWAPCLTFDKDLAALGLTVVR